MLVLSRREQQSVRVGDSIVLTVLRVAGDRVRIGIDAPQGMLILRDELEQFSSGPRRAIVSPVESIQADGLAAMSGSDG